MNETRLADDVVSRLLREAREARKTAYVPYSGFAVGSAVLFLNGEIIKGCNVENASYGLSICAERNAMTSAVACGLTKPVAIAVVGNSGESCSPCGACRQFLAEFNADMAVILERGGGYDIFCLSDLLPRGFSLAANKKERPHE